MRQFLGLALTLLALTSALADRATASSIIIVDVSQASTGQTVLAASLQGLVNRSPDGPRVFLHTNTWNDEWLSFALRLHPSETAEVTVEELLRLTRDRVKGQVLYDPAQPWTLDLATTTAGLQDLAVTGTDLGLPTIFDFRSRFRSPEEAYAWAVKELLPQCDRSAAALLPSTASAARDFAVMRRLFTFSQPQDPAEGWFQSVLKRLPPGSAIYGAASPEGLAELSAASLFLTPAGETANLSFLTAMGGADALHQYRPYLEPVADRYLTLIFDCSSLDFALGEMNARWTAPERGTLALGWALPGMLAEAAPAAARQYYADAYWSGTDQFILGGNGAGHLLLRYATAPFGFYRATQQAARRLDIHAAVYDVANSSRDTLGDDLLQFLHATGLSGAFVTGLGDMEPLLLGASVVLAAPRVTTAEEAVTYLNRLPLDRRCAALLLDARVLGPADAAHIAAHVATRYLLVAPEEMIELVRDMALPRVEGTAAVGIAGVDYTEIPRPDEPLHVAASIVPPEQLYSATLVYQAPGKPFAYADALHPGEDGLCSGAAPPFLQGGKVELRVRARDVQGRTTWSPSWTLSVPRADTDQDGLSEAEETFLATDPARADTDADGLFDANDSRPRDFDRFIVTYAGPVTPPGDSPYLPQPGKSSLAGAAREVSPGDSCLYWLPLVAIPSETAMVATIAGEGVAAIAVGSNPERLLEAASSNINERWYSAPLGLETRETGVYIRISCPADAAEAVRIYSLAIVSPPEAPSVSSISHYPPDPGPEQPITVSTIAFSPPGLRQVQLAYRINGVGTITVPMQPVEERQRYRARIPSLENRDQLDYWIIATDGKGRTQTTIPIPVTIGGQARETIALLARRDFLGDWVSSGDWGGDGRLAPQPGAVDHAFVVIRGGTYTIWALAGGRGNGLAVYAKNDLIGRISPGLPDGWQRIGRVKLVEGRQEIRLVAESSPDAPERAAPRYAVMLLTADSTFEPPPGRVVDVRNSLSLLSPAPHQTIGGSAEVRATGAGNITGVELLLDGEVLRQIAGPPFRAILNLRRVEPGEHTLQLKAIDRDGPTGPSVEIPVIVAPTQVGNSE